MLPSLRSNRRTALTALAGVCSAALLLLTAPVVMAQNGGHDKLISRDTQNDGGKDVKSEPYPLDVCPVSGKKLGSNGDPILKIYDGREVRFCCNNCPRQFEASKAKYLQKIDKEIVKEQMAFYPLTTCPISGEALGGMGAPIDLVYNNRLVRFCCKNCVKKFEKDPTPTLAKLDEAATKQQSEKYPLTTCLVSHDSLHGDMGGPIDRVYYNHLVRFCCKDCIKSFEKEPAKYLAVLDDAWKKQGGVPAAVSTGEKDASEAHHDHK